MPSPISSVVQSVGGRRLLGRLKNQEHIDERFGPVARPERRRCEIQSVRALAGQDKTVLVDFRIAVVDRLVDKAAAVAGDEIGSIRSGYIESPCV